MAFRCDECGAQAPRWEGRCPRCGAWGALAATAETARGPPEPRPLREVGTAPVARLGSGILELDRVLGGGLVPGSVVLVGGEPGIGKSTLLLGMSARLGKRALYVAGEESAEQVVLRARRLGLGASDLRLLECTDTAIVKGILERERPAVCIVDSVQTLVTPGVDGAPGGPSQVRAAAGALVPVARATRTALLLVGQVTKIGNLAGPRYLEHAVDTVLLFEGERSLSVRALRAVKNRFGPTDEIGLFEMREEGLKEVRNASDLLLSGRTADGPGSIIAVAMQGRRALCVEVQALLAGDGRAGNRRRAQGVDPRRLDLLVGVVESLFAPGVASRDVFVNVVGGLSVHDTGVDLAVAAAVLGAHEGRSVATRTAVIGEVGLRGEIRAVPHLVGRLKEARAMGFEAAYVPAGVPPLGGIRLREVARVDEVLEPREKGGPPPQQQTTSETAP